MNRVKRKLIFGGIAVLAIVAVAAWNVSLISQQGTELSSIAIENVEAFYDILRYVYVVKLFPVN
jgi:hypothetical protein